MKHAAQVIGNDAEATISQALRDRRPYRGGLRHIVQQQQCILAIAPLRVSQPHP